jgi:glycosyltransferase involved in cell wall biosynthesis
MKHNTAIIIPALNEAGNIYRLVKSIQSIKIPDTLIEPIVVDNGSSDDTAYQAKAAGAIVITESRRGYGYACSAGVAAAEHFDFLVFIDADFSSDPEELPRILDPILTDRADLCLGSRELGDISPGAMPPHQRFGNQLVSWLMRILYGIHVTDLGPYRAIRRDILNQLNMQEMTFGWPTEMMVKAARQQLHFVEVPVSWNKRQAGRSKIGGTLKGTILAAWYILGVTLRYAWKK